MYFLMTIAGSGRPTDREEPSASERVSMQRYARVGGAARGAARAAPVGEPPSRGGPGRRRCLLLRAPGERREPGLRPEEQGHGPLRDADARPDGSNLEIRREQQLAGRRKADGYDVSSAASELGRLLVKGRPSIAERPLQGACREPQLFRRVVDRRVESSRVDARAAPGCDGSRLGEPRPDPLGGPPRGLTLRVARRARMKRLDPAQLLLQRRFVHTASVRGLRRRRNHECRAHSRRRSRRGYGASNATRVKAVAPTERTATRSAEPRARARLAAFVRR